MIQAFSHIFNFFNIASPCGDMMGILNGTYEWSGEELFNSHYYDQIGIFFHPSKLIYYNASALGNKFCEKFIQNKCSHF
jgi:hypothetical protein